MRRFLHKNRWATMMVVALLMFATSGISLSRMTCLIGGHSEWSIGLIDECCPDADHDMATIEAECCEIGQTDRFQGIFVAHADLDIDALLLVLDAVPFSIISISDHVPAFVLEERVPPDETGDRLAVLGSFVI